MSRFSMDPDVIRMLAAILTETGLTEIEIAEKDSRIRVVRAPPVMAPVAVPVASTAPAVTAAVGTPSAGVENDFASHPNAVLSPMVGIAYLLPEPGAAPFIAVGDTVAAGQTVLLIEAMKTFNQIKAPHAGTVSRILVANGSPVEYDEPLMLIDP